MGRNLGLQPTCHSPTEREILMLRTVKYIPNGKYWFKFKPRGTSIYIFIRAKLCSYEKNIPISNQRGDREKFFIQFIKPKNPSKVGCRLHKEGCEFKTYQRRDFSAIYNPSICSDNYQQLYPVQIVLNYSPPSSYLPWILPKYLSQMKYKWILSICWHS